MRRLKWVALVALFPAAFMVGQMLARSGAPTVRAAEATPVPSELPPGIVRFHDAGEGVTCWDRRGGGLSCLPDQWLASARDDGGAP